MECRLELHSPYFLFYFGELLHELRDSVDDSSSKALRGQASAVEREWGWHNPLRSRGLRLWHVFYLAMSEAAETSPFAGTALLVGASLGLGLGVFEGERPGSDGLTEVGEGVVWALDLHSN